MGLTTRELQNKLSIPTIPYYYEVRTPCGKQRHCGTMKDVKCVMSNYPGSTVEKIYCPSPDTVDVPHIIVGEEQTLPMQQILPESDLQPFNTNDQES